MKGIILAGGHGSKIWPYNEIRNKCMIPISNKPILSHTVDAFKENDIDDIYIIGTDFMSEIKHLFKDEQKVHVIEMSQSHGSADSLLNSGIHEDCVFIFGDCLVQKDDIKKIIKAQKNTLLLGKVLDDPHQHIVAIVHENKLQEFIAYPRGCEEGYFLVGGYLDQKIFKYLEYNSGRFMNTKVGVGSPQEKILEETLNDYKDNEILNVVVCNDKVFDIDKPWHILQANAYNNKKICENLKENNIDPSAKIDSSAQINGFVQLGKESYIGKNVTILGNVIIGDYTKIDNGAIISENCIIGHHCTIQNHCKLGSEISIGDLCIVEQTAEMLGGLLMKKNYLYHHGEFYGICGERCDLGAGTVCGTLRFDDGQTMHQIQGRKEIPQHFANATFIGDYSRCGVGTIFLPGSMVGVNSVVGAGTILNKVVPSFTLIYPKQELVEKEWGYQKYGW